MSKARQSTFERLNRRQRRGLRQRLFSNDPGLNIVNINAAGVDVGNESHYVAVPADRDQCPVQEFGCWTADLKRMCEWLKACRIDTVAMQATGVYWIPVYDLLEQHGFHVFLVNAQHTRNVPGRKTDVQESQWLMKLHTYGLLRNSFQLPEQMQAVRTIWRLRDRHVKEAGEAIQHMQKALTKMNVQLANTISDISGVTGRAIIGAILAGERDPYKLADLRDPHVHASREEVARSLEGNWRADLLFELQQAKDAYEFAHLQMRNCDERLKAYLAELPVRVREQDSVPAERAQPAVRKKGPRRKQKARGNAPEWDLKPVLRQIPGRRFDHH